MQPCFCMIQWTITPLMNNLTQVTDFLVFTSRAWSESTQPQGFFVNLCSMNLPGCTSNLITWYPFGFPLGYIIGECMCVARNLASLFRPWKAGALGQEECWAYRVTAKPVSNLVTCSTWRNIPTIEWKVPPNWSSKALSSFPVAGRVSARALLYSPSVL